MANAVFVAFLILLTTAVIGATPPPYEALNERVVFYSLPQLRYGLGELEPFIPATTANEHYFGIHFLHMTKMNNILQDWRRKERTNVFSRSSILDIIRHPDDISETYRETVTTDVGGFINHCLMWTVLKPNPKMESRPPPGRLIGYMNEAFGSFEELKEQFNNETMSLVGSGYVWLVRRTFTKDGGLAIVSTTNEDNPLSRGMMPLLVIDVWEHAYYLKHLWKRERYLADWWSLVEWNNVAELERFWLSTLDEEEHWRKRDEL